MRILFVHVYASGGTSLSKCIERTVGEQYVCPSRLYPFSGDLSQYNFMAGHFRLIDGLQAFRPDLVVTLFRDPVERIYSIYNKLRVRHGKQHVERIDWLRKISSHDFRFFLDCATHPSKYPWSYIYFGATPVEAEKNIRRYVDKVFLLDKPGEILGWLQSIGFDDDVFPRENAGRSRQKMRPEDRRLAEAVTARETDFINNVRALHHHRDEGTDHCY